MYKFVILLIILSINSSIFSQNTYEYLYSTEHAELSRSIIEDFDGNLYFPVENFEFGLIIKLDSEGNFADSIHISNPSGSCNISELIRRDSNHFIALGHWMSDTATNLWFILFDNHLQKIKEKMLNSNNTTIYDFKYIINHNGNIVFIAIYIPDDQGYYDVCIYEITYEGQVKRFKFFDFIGINQNFTILENSEDSTYKVFTKNPLNNRLLCHLTHLDSNFNLMGNSVWLGSEIDSHNTAKWISDSTYLLTGEKYDFTTDEWDLGILKMSDNDYTIASFAIGTSDTVDWPGLYKNLDFVSLENIFYAGSKNSYWFPFQNEPSWIMLNILDTGLNLKSQHYYGGDAYYLVNAILATQDSGCVMACTRYDWMTPENDFDVYILKVNKDGLLVSTPEMPALCNQPCFIYPNPGYNVLNINVPINDLHFEMVDLNGKKVVSCHLEKGSNTINLYPLPNGMFIYHILNNRSVMIQSGKWLKIK